jgi:hypothetical protein
MQLTSQCQQVWMFATFSTRVLRAVLLRLQPVAALLQTGL